MLRVVAHKSAAAARQYYAEGLRREDYYSEGQEVAGKWHGIAAELLGISGGVTPEAFAALVENRHPVTGERLTPRTKAERVVGYDLNFHAPKSLSLLHALTGDEEIVRVFREAVAETMTELEAKTSTRVRQRGAQANRITGNFAWAEFVHFTARPVSGIPDPHLHVHGFVFNATFDPVEERWKAAKFRDIKADAPYSQAAFHARLTAKLSALGYGIERTPKGWEIEGVPRDLVERFSQRTAQIERLAAEKGITDAKAKDGLGAASREGKRHGLTFPDLLAAWSVRLTQEDKASLSKLRFDKPHRNGGARMTPSEALDYACEKLFAKHSVVEQSRLLAEAMRYGIGKVTPEAVTKEFERREMVVREVKGQVLCTSVDVLAEEIALINFVRKGRGQHAALKPADYRELDTLSAEQSAAVDHLLKSRDQVMAIRGGAGVGKTTLMREAVAAIERSGLRVFAFAPSAAASRETLRESGFSGAETVAHLLMNPKVQRETRGQVIWIDEAGLLGVRDMWRIMEVAGTSTRVILTGDTQQHAPVARGDAFRLLQDYSGLRVAEVTEIRRQERADYKQAVAALSQGDLRTGFRRLEQMGAIQEIPDAAERYRTLASDYVSLSRQGSPPLVVSPTHAEGAAVTDAIREAKREAGVLGAERSFVRFHNLQWEEADRKRTENYREGLVVQFHQNAKGIRRGEMFRVAGRDETGAVKLVGEGGRQVTLPEKMAARFQVFEEREIAVARGDRIRITRNGETADGRRISNGNVFTVEKFNRAGDMVLTTGAVIPRDHGHFTHGYCQTSHASQSKSVRDVLVAQCADSFLASSREQFYVSVSRGKESIRIYTDDRRGLQEAVGNTSTRCSGLELAGINRQDISTFMSEMNAKQWRDAVQSRRVDGDAKTHVQNLLNERRQNVAKKQEGMNWKQYIEMRRANAGADGKSRARVGSAEPKKAPNNEMQKGRSFARPTSLTTDVNNRMLKAAADRKAGKQPETPKPDPRTSRIAKAYRQGAENFKKVAERLKNQPQAKPSQPAKKPLPASNTERAARHAQKQKVHDAGIQAKQQVKTKQQAPTPRRGK